MTFCDTELVESCRWDLQINLKIWPSLINKMRVANYGQVNYEPKLKKKSLYSFVDWMTKSLAEISYVKSFARLTNFFTKFHFTNQC